MTVPQSLSKYLSAGILLNIYVNMMLRSCFPQEHNKHKQFPCPNSKKYDLDHLCCLPGFNMTRHSWTRCHKKHIFSRTTAAKEEVTC